MTIFHNHDILHAIQFVELHHRQQRRKYTDEPYLVHLLAVAKAVSCARLPKDIEDRRESMMIASLLHDVVEDQPVTIEQISTTFGSEVAALVAALTDCDKSVGNRAKRKEIDRQRLSEANEAVKIIKCADIIDNMHSICTYDPKFARTFLFEVGELLPLLENKSSLYRELLDKYAQFNPLSTVDIREMKKGW